MCKRFYVVSLNFCKDTTAMTEIDFRGLVVKSTVSTVNPAMAFLSVLAGV
jgi:hypothetical protein